MTHDESPEGIRLNKYVARSGVASRRKSADLVKAGKVSVNGAIEKNPAYLVQPGDTVEYEGKKLRAEQRLVYILLNKPKNVITTLADERGRKSVHDLVARHYSQRIYPIGRLDRMTTGLLVLTNDGDLAQKLSHPSSEVKKVYHVVLDKPLTQRDKKQIAEGLELEDGLAVVDAIDYVLNKPRSEVGIELHSGKNRIIRRLFEHLGYSVVRLDRTYYAGLTKKDLPRGRFRSLRPEEIRMLKYFIGTR